MHDSPDAFWATADEEATTKPAEWRRRLDRPQAATVLAGGAVAAAGPVAFVGLAVPHGVRLLTGPDHHVLLPGCVLVGPSLLLLADVLGRIVMYPLELEVGIVTAFLGAPVLIALARHTNHRVRAGPAGVETAAGIPRPGR